MWAATVRRCPPGQLRYQSQFGARLQLARALTHAPYLICDGLVSYSRESPFPSSGSGLNRVPFNYTRQNCQVPPGSGRTPCRSECCQPSVAMTTPDVIIQVPVEAQDGHGNASSTEVWTHADCWSDRPLLIRKGTLRETLRTILVIDLSFTLVTFVVMGFMVRPVAAIGIVKKFG